MENIENYVQRELDLIIKLSEAVRQGTVSVLSIEQLIAKKIVNELDKKSEDKNIKTYQTVIDLRIEAKKAFIRIHNIIKDDGGEIVKEVEETDSTPAEITGFVWIEGSNPPTPIAIRVLIFRKDEKSSKVLVTSARKEGLINFKMAEKTVKRLTSYWKEWV